MKPASFVHRAPTTIDEAVAALSSGGEVKVLAGGQSLIPVLALRLAKFDRLVDLRLIDELQQVDVGPESARVGAMVRQAHAERHTGLSAAVPLLPLALGKVGRFQIRNRGTIGGSIAPRRPGSRTPRGGLALDATFEATGPSGQATSPQPTSSRERSPPPSTTTRSSPQCDSPCGGRRFWFRRGRGRPAPRRLRPGRRCVRRAPSSEGGVVSGAAHRPCSASLALRPTAGGGGRGGAGRLGSRRRRTPSLGATMRWSASTRPTDHPRHRRVPPESGRGPCSSHRASRSRRRYRGGRRWLSDRSSWP